MSYNFFQCCFRKDLAGACSKRSASVSFILKKYDYSLYFKTFLLFWLSLLTTNPDPRLTSLYVVVQIIKESQIWENTSSLNLTMILPLLTLKFSQWTGIVKQYFSELADDNELVSNSANGLLAWLYLDCLKCFG